MFIENSTNNFVNNIDNKNKIYAPMSMKKTGNQKIQININYCELFTYIILFKYNF